MKKILLGVALELAAFAVLLLSERWQLPLTFALFAHLIAVYFFTTGFDPRLAAIRLRRELCFFFTLIFPLAGMAGMGFYIVVLKRIESRLKLEDRSARPAPAPLPAEETSFLEDDAFSALASAHVRRVSAPLAHASAWHATAAGPPADCCREKEYWRREQELSERIKVLEVAVATSVSAAATAAAASSTAAAITAASSSASETTATAVGASWPAKQQLADSLIEYVTMFRADPRLRGLYLERARAVYRELGSSVLEERPVMEKLAEISFLDRRYKECLGLCDELRRADAWNLTALLCQGECYFQLKAYKKLALWARELLGSSAVPAGLKEIAEMWCQYG